GESRLLHLDDWKELDKFVSNPLGGYKFTYKAPASKNVDDEVERATFFKQNDKPCISFIDQFAYPETIEQAKYLRDLSHSMENEDRKSTRLNSSHVSISYAVFCLKKKKKNIRKSYT